MLLEIIIGGFILLGATVVVIGGPLSGESQRRWEELNADYHERTQT